MVRRDDRQKGWRLVIGDYVVDIAASNFGVCGWTDRQRKGRYSKRAKNKSCRADIPTFDGPRESWERATCSPDLLMLQDHRWEALQLVLCS
jgi:hypothetical protein